VDGDTARLEGTGDEARVLDAGRGGSLCLSVGGRPHRVYGVRVGETEWEIHHRGRSYRVEVADERSWRVRRAQGNGSAAAAGLEPLHAPMPGLVLRVDVEEGQEVAESQGLLIVEAMKMENELRARATGRVRRVHVAAGESVRRGDLLIEFEQDADSGRDSGGIGDNSRSDADRGGGR
jgi:biotin carboxyl carrier protein